MSQKFSLQLIERIKRYFQECYGLVISDDLANEYLDSLAELYLVFSNCEGPHASGRVSGRGGGLAILN